MIEKKDSFGLRHVFELRELRGDAGSLRRRGMRYGFSRSLSRFIEKKR